MPAGGGGAVGLGVALDDAGPEARVLRGDETGRVDSAVWVTTGDSAMLSMQLTTIYGGTAAVSVAGLPRAPGPVGLQAVQAAQAATILPGVSRVSDVSPRGCVR